MISQTPKKRVVKTLTVKAYKTYKERADYLSFINPMREEIYQSIAEFFGEDNIPCDTTSSHEPQEGWEKQLREDAVVFTVIEAEEVIERGGDSHPFIYIDDAVAFIKQLLAADRARMMKSLKFKANYLRGKEDEDDLTDFEKGYRRGVDALEMHAKDAFENTLIYPKETNEEV